MLLRRRSPVETVTQSALNRPFSTGASWLARALIASALLHGIVVIAMALRGSPTSAHEPELVDIEMAPPPPPAEALPAEVAKPPEVPPAPPHEDVPAATAPDPGDKGELAADAGVADARRTDAMADAGVDAPVDAPIDAAPDAALVASADDGGAGSAALASDARGESTVDGIATGSGVPAAIAIGSGSGVPGMIDTPQVDGAPTTAGTAANLLAYFPPGHVVTALVRFDRLRGSEWAPLAERVFRPLPDYHALFGDHDADIADKLDLLVISSPRPRDATATTLVMRTAMSRAAVRDLLANPKAPITWSAAKGGMFGKRTSKLFANDRRVMLSPWRNWYLLAQPDDLGGLVAPATGNLDAIETKGVLPPWLGSIRTIEKESGDDAKRGPAVVVTLGNPPVGTAPAKSGRYKIPDVGLGLTSLPVPDRVSAAMELVAQGWLVRGNIVFANEADAAELIASVQATQQRITDSHLLSALLRRQHALNAIAGLTLQRTGARVSFGTSLSIADARAVFAAVALTLGEYFQGP